MIEYDCAIISSFRDVPKDLTKCATKYDNLELDNKVRNRNLKALLLKKKYGVTAVDGSYIENFETPAAIEVSEASLFIVNLINDSNFKNIIISLSEKNTVLTVF